MNNPHYLYKLYRRWVHIRERCHKIGYANPEGWELYGGRGISLYEGWRNDYQAFKVYCLELEPNLEELLDKKYQIDRIDTNGNYEPGNIRFVQPKINANNKRNNVLHSFKGELLTLSQIFDKYRNEIHETIKQVTVQSRLSKGWDFERAILTPCLRRDMCFYEGEYHSWTKLLGELNVLNLPEQTIKMRLAQRWSVKDALNIPLRECREGKGRWDNRK